MKQSVLWGGLPLLAIVSLTGCIDDKYDLSDIDTTSSFKVKDLVIPVNIESITLGDVIKIHDGDQIQEVELNGKKVYAVNQSGSFTSNVISIGKINTPVEQPVSEQVTFNPSSAVIPAGREVKVPFPNKVKRTVIYKAESLDEAIEEITEIFLDDSVFEIQFSIPSQPANLSFAITDLEFTLPKGMTVDAVTPNGTYDSATGKCTVSRIPITDGKGKVEILISAINLVESGDEIDSEIRELDIVTHIDIEKANLSIAASGSNALVPSSINLDIDYQLADMNISAISGKVDYNLEGIDIDPVNLNEIPDVFSQPGTNLVLSNPQIYLSLNNPIASYGLNYQIGLSLESLRDGEPSKKFELDNGYFEVKHNKGESGPYNFCLSPEEPSSFPQGFENAQHEEFSKLGDVLSGNGLPQSIKISLPNTKIYSQPVDHFVLGVDINGLKGEWEFLAPLALASDGNNESVIIYSKTQDGWSDDEVDAIEIEQLVLTAKVDNNLPVSAELSGFPIGKNGNQIGSVKFEPVMIPEGARNYPIELKLTGGKIKNLDGITYTVKISGDSGEALSPEQTFTLNDIRVKVSGNYTKEL